LYSALRVLKWRAVVAGVKDDGVVEQVQAAQGIQDAAERLIEALDHAEVARERLLSVAAD
jgi:hypothetical protein